MMSHRPLAPEHLKIARQEFKLILELGIIQPCSSDWSSPLHMVPWVIGVHAVDCQALNNMTVPDRFPIPHMHTELSMVLLSSSRYTWFGVHASRPPNPCWVCRHPQKCCNNPSFYKCHLAWGMPHRHFNILSTRYYIRSQFCSIFATCPLVTSWLPVAAYRGTQVTCDIHAWSWSVNFYHPFVPNCA